MKTLLSLTIVAATLINGCSADMGAAETEQALTPSPISEPFFNHHVKSTRFVTDPLFPFARTWYMCDTNQVMVGIHFKQNKLICADLNGGLRTGNPSLNPPKAEGGTQVSSNPTMHGCPPGRFIQGIMRNSVSDPDGSEHLKCVPIVTSTGIALNYSGTLHDGRGPNDRGTQSDIAYGLLPAMHACPQNHAMVGVHQMYNDLFCAR